jgi:hypothetical protein
MKQFEQILKEGAGYVYGGPMEDQLMNIILEYKYIRGKEGCLRTLDKIKEIIEKTYWDN